MIKPKSFEELASYVEKKGKQVFLFTADWCSDCRFIYPVLPDIETENPEFTFIQVDRDDFMPVAQKWDIYGIPSLVVLEDGKEIGRLVNKLRKTKEEINQFLNTLK